MISSMKGKALDGSEEFMKKWMADERALAVSMLERSRVETMDGKGVGAFDAELAAKAFDAAARMRMHGELAEAVEDRRWVEAVELGSKALGLSPLVEACREGCPGSVVEALAASAPESKKLEAAISAARYGNAQGAIALIRRGVPLDAKSYDGRTLLHYCAADDKAGHLDLLAYLLAEGADAGGRESQFGASPLAWACYSNNPGAAKQLAGKGLLDDLDWRGRSPLAYCVEKSTGCARILLAFGAKLHARSDGKPCAFERAMEAGAPEAPEMAMWADWGAKSSQGLDWIECAKQFSRCVASPGYEALLEALGKVRADHERKELSAHVPESREAKDAPRRPLAL